MTPQEFQHIKRVVAALESGEYSAMDQHKMLMTVSQITERAAASIKESLEETQGA
jgi:hypothetical protein